LRLFRIIILSFVLLASSNAAALCQLLDVPASGLIRQAYNQIQVADYSGAEATLNEAIRQNGSDFVARRYLAYVLIQKKEPKQALDILSTLPSRTHFDLFLRGAAAEVMGEPKKSLEFFSEAVREAPQNDTYRDKAIEAAIVMSEYPRASNMCSQGMNTSTNANKRRYYEDELKHTQELTAAIAKGRPCIHGQ
jgi:tetratricopeptide (TPR) repeat protein